MAGPRSAGSSLGIEPHQDWLARLVADARLALSGQHWPGGAVDASIDAPSPRRAPPFGGYLASGQQQAPPPGARISAAFGGVPSMDPYESAELRRQQADFARTTRDIDRQNSWFAVPALAPEMVVSGLEMAGGIAEALAGGQARRSLLAFPEREPPRIIRGDNRYARAGMRAHADLNARVAQKPGWRTQPTIRNARGVFRPDAGMRVPDPAYPDTRFQLELKPDTPSGRRAAARAVKRYIEGTGNKTRAIFYDPEDYL